MKLGDLAHQPLKAQDQLFAVGQRSTQPILDRLTDLTQLAPERLIGALPVLRRGDRWEHEVTVCVRGRPQRVDRSVEQQLRALRRRRAVVRQLRGELTGLVVLLQLPKKLYRGVAIHQTERLGGATLQRGARAAVRRGAARSDPKRQNDQTLKDL